MLDLVGIVLLVLVALYIYTLVLLLVLDEVHQIWLFLAILDAALIIAFMFTGTAVYSLYFALMLIFHMFNFNHCGE